MARVSIDIDIDDELIAAAMSRYDFHTIDEAVDFALRTLVGPRLTSEFLKSLRGIGWEGDLAIMRSDDSSIPADRRPPSTSATTG